MPNNNAPMRFCPNCGQTIKPGYTHCPNCGYDLVHHQMPNIQPPHRSTPQPNPQPQMRRIDRQPKRSHKLTIFIIILILIICGGGGYYIYKTHTNHQSTTESSQSINDSNHTNTSNKTSNSSSKPSSSSSTISEDEAASQMDRMWSCINDIATNNNPSDSLSSFFENGSSNHDYHTVNGWAKDMSNSNNLKGLKLTPHIKSIKADGKDSDVTYQVDYVFHYSGDTKKQGFIWHAKMAKVDSSWEVITNKADNSHPVYND